MLSRNSIGLIFVAVVVTLAVVSLTASGAEADGAKSVSSGSDFTCAVTEDGGAKCWGSDSIGELGTGAAAPEICTSQFSDEFPCSKSPVDVMGLTSGVRSVAAGTSHACALLDAGTVKCWGLNRYGELGSGALGPDTCPTTFIDYPCSLAPVDVVGLTDVAQVEAGLNHTCARTNGGAVKCWGLGGWGQLGAEGGDTCDGEECSMTPVDTTITDATDLATGGYHTCVVTDQGAAKCFGRDNDGQLGNGTPGPDSCHVGLTLPCSKTPAQVEGLTSGVTDITAGDSHTCAITGSGVKCWGDNFDAQLANDNGSKNCSLPVDECYSATPVDIAGVTGDVIEAGGDYTCVGPNIACWGSNRLGELDGVSGPDTCDSGYKCSYGPRSIDGISGNIMQLAPDGSHTCVLVAGGKVQCWGYGFYGQMGNGENANKYALPVSPTGFAGSGVTPTPHRLAGDADCDGLVTLVDGGVALGIIAGVSESDCQAQANVKCDDSLNVVDVLLFLKWYADVGIILPGGCPLIGE